MRRLTIPEFHVELKAQGVPRDDIAMKCPLCGTVQSARDLIAAGAGATFEEVDRYLGFHCIGRFTDAPGPRATPDGDPCNWTLGGLFRTHRLEVVDDRGFAHPIFEPATPEEARRHAQRVPA